MRLSQRPIAIAAFAALMLTSVTASAAGLAGLQVEIGPNVDANVRSEIENAVDGAVKSVSYWQWTDVSTTRSQLNPIVRDCFTSDCLQKAGDSTGSDAGLRVRFTGEAQIYDWTVEIFDLRNGGQLKSTKGSCELCGRSEVVREFRSTVKSIATATRLPRRSAPVASQPDPVKTEPDPEPTKTEPTTTEPAGTTTTTDPLGDLTVLDIDVQPEDAIIFLEGQEVGRGSISMSLEPGSYEFRFAREGYRGFKETFAVNASTPSRATMRVHMSKNDPDAVMVPPAEGPVDRLGTQRITYGIIGLAAGGVLIGTGMYLSYLDGSPACEGGDFTDCPELYETSTGAFLSTFVGTALATGGAALLAWEALSGPTNYDSKQPRVAPAVSPDGAGLVLFGRF